MVRWYKLTIIIDLTIYIPPHAATLGCLWMVSLGDEIANKLEHEAKHGTSGVRASRKDLWIPAVRIKLTSSVVLGVKCDHASVSRPFTQIHECCCFRLRRKLQHKFQFFKARYIRVAYARVL